MNFNISSLLYLFYRLSPFIIVCFFTLGSIINSELKGFVYLIGLIFTFVVCFNFSLENGTQNVVCNSFNISDIPGHRNTPISIVVFSYTFFYLLFPIVKYDIAADNIPMLIFFPIFILADLYWNMVHSCFSLLNCMLIFGLAGGIALGWAAIIYATKLKQLQYYNVGSNREICSRPSQQKFQCNYYKNGEKIS